MFSINKENCSKNVSDLDEEELFTEINSLQAELIEGGYNAPKLSHVYSDPSGKVLIKWPGSPRPFGPCGRNFGWVEIPSTASKIMKDLALSIYFNGKAARIDTSGCSGTRERVTALYSPGG